MSRSEVSRLAKELDSEVTAFRERPLDGPFRYIWLDAMYAATRLTCPSLSTKRVTPHTLQHTAAMDLLRRGVDLSIIALWLGHESSETTQIYLHADMGIKERALAHASADGAMPSRYQAPDALLAFLEGL